MSAAAAPAAPDPTFVIAMFSTAFPNGPAYGTPKQTTWREFTTMVSNRREGSKDGANFVAAEFKPEQNCEVRRLKENVVARTAVCLDVEINRTTGEVPLSPANIAIRLEDFGWAAVVYTSHSHTAAAPRYRIVLPVSAKLGPDLPVIEVIAELLDISGVIDRGKLGAASLFYLPSAEPGQGAHHETHVIDGCPVDAQWLATEAGKLLADREAEQAKQRAEALEAATRRRTERIARGFDPDDSLIEKVRGHLDLAGELASHGYKRVGAAYLFPGSQTGIPGVHVMAGRDGVDRVFSHHAADPLAAGNLPAWCGTKGAIDVVDVVAILDHGGDRTKALRTLATRFGITSKPRLTIVPPISGEEPPPPTGEDDYGSTTSISDEPEPVDKSQAKVATLDGDLKPYSFVDPCSLHAKPIPERQWIVPEWLPAGHVTALYGDGGVGKTLLAQQLMTSCATGIRWCDINVNRCRALAVFCEDDPNELHRRQQQINIGADIHFSDLADMRWASGMGLDNLLVTFDHNGRSQLTDRLHDIERQAIEFGAKLVVIDTAADTFGGNENDWSQVRQFVGHALNRLALSIGGAVLLNAHPSRSGMSATGDMDGGSTAWSNTVRSRWSLVRPKQEDGDAVDPNERILTRRKANYAAIGDTIRLKWSNGVLVPFTVRGETGGGGIQQSGADAVFLTLLDRCTESNIRLSSSNRAGNWAPKVFGRRPDREGYTARDFDAAMSGHVRQGGGNSGVTEAAVSHSAAVASWVGVASSSGGVSSAIASVCMYRC